MSHAALLYNFLIKAMLLLSRAKFVSLFFIGLASAVLIGCGGGGNQTAGGTATASFVAVTQMVKHPALNAVRDGLKDALAEAGYREGETLRWEWLSAQGSPPTATRIANKYVRARPDVIVAIATPSAQAVATAAKNTPVIFSAVTDPVGASIIKNTNKPGGNVTGVSDLSPIDQNLALIQEILPEAAALGVIYSADEESGSNLVDLVKAEASNQGFSEVTEVTVYAPEEVAAAARSLVGLVDAIYVPTDKTVLSALESVVQVGQDNDVPVFAGGKDAADRGAIAALSFDYYDIGHQTGEMVVKVLKGNRPGDLPVEYVDNVQLSMNPKSAAEMGVTLPEGLIERADKVVE